MLKYCLNTTTIADTVILIVLDWSRPWTFMETLQRWVKVLEGAIEQIRQEGAVATATWTKGKALMDELQEKCKLEASRSFFGWCDANSSDRTL